MSTPTISTLGQLKAQGYQSKKIKDELRDNLLQRMKDGVEVFVGIWGYEDSVIPELERAILSRHNINLLGLRAGKNPTGATDDRLTRRMDSFCSGLRDSR